MDEATVQRLMEAAIRATQASSTQSVQTLRKPDLPVFDKKNVEIWIKRVEAAYARVHCTSPALKFAHLETKFDVGADPVVDEFLFGEATEDSWRSFLEYLRTRHAPNTKERALTVISGTPREGRTPTQLAAIMKEKAGSVTIDDVLKEQLLKELPPEIHRQIIDKVDGLTFEQTGQLADKWFDKDGKPLLATNPSTINNVTRPPTPSPAASASASDFTAPFEDPDEEADINAVRFRQGQRQNFRVQNGSSSRGKSQNGAQNGGQRGGNSSRPQENSNTSGNGRGSGGGSSQKKVCPFHIKYGDKAERCLPWCMLHPTHTPKGKASQ